MWKLQEILVVSIGVLGILWGIIGGTMELQRLNPPRLPDDIILPELDLFIDIIACERQGRDCTPNERLLHVNNREWVSSHQSNLSSLDVAATFDYVRKHHPLLGCAYSRFPPVRRSDSLVELSDLADAVTIARTLEVGDAQSPSELFDLPRVTHTNLGNMAFVALNHAHQRIRQEYELVLMAWMNEARRRGNDPRKSG